MPFKTINSREIYYELHGKENTRDTIVLLHHGFGCSRMWKVIYPLFVHKGYCILAYDRRGYGRSEGGYNFKDFYVSNDFRSQSVKEMAELLDLLDICSFHIIGQCEGGVIGVDYSAVYPDQVKTLVASSTQCYSNIPMYKKNAIDANKSFKELDSDLRKKLKEWHGENAEPFFEQFRKYGGAYGTDYFDLRDSLSKVACPTLVLYPDRSSIFDVEQGVAFFKHLLKGELAVLPACGHNTYEYYPDDYVRIVLNFYERHEGNR